MSDTPVQYTMSLKDMLTPGIKQADGAINHMEGSLNSLKGGLMEFGKVALASMGVLFSAEFLHQSVEAFNEQAQAMGQLNTVLESTSGIAGLTSEGLAKQAEALQKVTLYGDEATESMDSILLTFTNIRGEIFNNTVPLIQDLSTRMGQDLKSSAVQVGKSLNDPIKGITALQRVGVSFTESQKELIKHLASTGHMAEAQGMILKELQTEFGGAARAAAELGTGPLTVMKNAFNDVQEEVGELVMRVVTLLLPAMQGFVDLVHNTVTGIKEVAHWVKEHSSGLIFLAETLGIVIIAYKAFQAWQVLSYMWMMRDAIGTAIVTTAKAAWATVTGYLTTTQIALNAAITANPIGILIVAIAAAVAVVIACYKHFATFRAVLWGVWETVKEFGRIVMDVFIGINRVMNGVFTFNTKEISAGFSQAADAIGQSGQRLGMAFSKGYEGGLADFAKDKAAENAPKTVVKKAIGAVAPPAAGKKETAGAVGNKSISINIKIENLVKDIQIKTTNLTEGVSKVRDAVAGALLSAVNDSQIIAGS